MNSLPRFIIATLVDRQTESAFDTSVSVDTDNVDAQLDDLLQWIALYTVYLLL